MVAAITVMKYREHPVKVCFYRSHREKLYAPGAASMKRLAPFLAGNIRVAAQPDAILIEVFRS